MKYSEENLDSYVEAYDESFEFDKENKLMLQAYVESMLQHLMGKSGISILGLGIGHRVVVETLARNLGEALVSHKIIEGSKQIIDDFKKRNPDLKKLELLNCYFEDFYTDELFDAIEMGFVLEHVVDPASILSHYKKFLRPGGMLFAAVPNARSLHRELGHQAGFLDNCYLLSDADRLLGHKRYFDMESFEALISSAGFSVAHRYGLFLKPFTRSQMDSLNLDEKVYQALNKVAKNYPEISNGLLIVATA